VDEKRRTKSLRGVGGQGVTQGKQKEIKLRKDTCFLVKEMFEKARGVWKANLGGGGLKQLPHEKRPANNQTCAKTPHASKEI